MAVCRWSVRSCVRLWRRRPEKGQRQVAAVTRPFTSQAETGDMLVSDILAHKGKLVHTCGPDDTLADVADLLVGHNIGSLVVMQDEEMIGIVTERDILRASAATRGPLEFVRVRDRMTRCPIVASPGDAVADIMCVMTERRIRHVPVVEHGK